MEHDGVPALRTPEEISQKDVPLIRKSTRTGVLQESYDQWQKVCPHPGHGRLGTGASLPPARFFLVMICENWSPDVILSASSLFFNLE